MAFTAASTYDYGDTAANSLACAPGFELVGAARPFVCDGLDR